MNFIIDDANKLADRFYKFGDFFEAKDIIDKVEDYVMNLTYRLDRIKFITCIVERTNKEKEESSSDALALYKESNDIYDRVVYFLNQELEDLGVIVNEDTFTAEEKQQAEDKINKLLIKIDELLKDNQTLKNGQEILYNELQEHLRLLFH